MRKMVVLVLALAVAACKADPSLGAAELLKKGDIPGAQAVLEKLALDKPELKDTHYRLFLIYRLLATRAGSGDKLMQAAISEYTLICKQEGIPADYQRMEESLKSSEKTKAAYEAAYALVYSR